jgi:hypothetical protein
MPTEAKTPAKLGAKGKALWNQIITGYDLRPDEVRTLEDVCREADLIERLEEQLRGSDLMVKGSQGQLVASPLVSELRQHRATLTVMLKALKLPDTDATAQRQRDLVSEQARSAARARWDRPRQVG